MLNFKNKLSLLIGISLFLSIHTACTYNATYGDPAEILTKALSQINESEQIALYGTSEAFISGYTFVETDALYKEKNQQWVKVNESGKNQNELSAWNTLLSIKQLQNVSKNVTIDSELSKADLTVINIDIEPADLEKIIKQNLFQQLEQIEHAYDSTAELGRKHQEDKENAIVRARQRLNEMLKTLTVEAHYQMGIEQDTHLAKTLHVTTTLFYLSEGVRREETIKGTYDFKVVDKEGVIPQNL